MRPYWIRVAPNAMTSVLIKKRIGHRHTENKALKMEADMERCSYKPRNARVSSSPRS